MKQFGAFKLLPQKKPEKITDASSIRKYLVDKAVKNGFDICLFIYYHKLSIIVDLKL